EKGACFKSLILKNYREKVSQDSDLKEMISKENTIGTIIEGFSANSVEDLNGAVFTASALSDRIRVDGSSKKLTFSWMSKSGVVIEKTYTFHPDRYLIDLDLSILNKSDTVINDNLEISLVNKVSEKSNSYGFEGPSALINDKLEKVDLDDIDEKNSFTGNIKWVSMQDRYFISGLIPRQKNSAAMKLYLDENRSLKTTYSCPVPSLSPGEIQRIGLQIFMGPKSVSILKEANAELDLAVNFGFFDFIAKPCLWLMNFFYRYIPNYGIAIIIITALIKILFWPLGSKSYKSMNEMKKLQPLMAEIREKYKDDKKRMNEEVMGLYKTYKINPLGGCLPMVAQIPVFFALYQMLYGAIELRHAPFLGWINDLSAPDRLFEFGFSVPFMEPPYGIPVLTIIMGATMLMQQKLQPPAGDPMQAKMMMMMPIVFTVIFINFSSGLVLYWLINNILSIAQQYYISKTKA
ncbi:MAG: membrane protein insertase YidC, partial [Deltaproteobacteria bacterium]|nr:membrane protein insertase YidC [Deltaproteobacteria bacterium]